MIQLLLLLDHLLLHLSQGCKLEYTRKELERRSTSGRQRGGRSQDIPGPSSPGCSSEPGTFAGRSIEGFAEISMGDKDDCAIECARVKGCVAWTFVLHNATKNIRNRCWLMETDKNKWKSCVHVRGPPCNGYTEN